MSDAQQNDQGSTVEWVTLEESLNYPKISSLIPNRRAWYWELFKPHSQFKRRLVESGAMIKAGRYWRVSVSKAPGVIEEIYREQSLAALDRVSTPTSNRRRNTTSRSTESVAA